MTHAWTASSASPSQIFFHADLLVQSVIILLLFASVASWAVIMNRSWAISRERGYVRSVKRELTSVGTRSELRQLIAHEQGHVTSILQAIDAEWGWSNDRAGSGYEKTQERILTVAEMAIVREGRKLAGRTTWLATIGSTAPFVGLFGTVWGIMASFLAISQTQDTSLAVVAPGIAEALLATAIGLFCAIPAVIGYNRLQQGIGEVDAEWRSTAALLELAISRHSDSPAGEMN